MQTPKEAEADQARKMLGPKPETAPNRILSCLFSHPGIQQIKEKSTKARVIDFLKVLNKRKI